jgi:4-deoxy-L-threo-5-hexosulose-uronate ketol-isomerase
MEIRHATSPDALLAATTAQLRQRHLVESMFVEGEIRTVYSHEDRLVLGGTVPLAALLALRPDGPVNSPTFLSHRELGVLHIGGGAGAVIVDGTRYALDPLDMLYVGRGERNVEFASLDAAHPARFYFASAVAHRACPDRLVTRSEVVPVEIGTTAGASRRRLYRVVHPDHVETANLLMGYTELLEGQVWNTMPPHLHDRRTEAYFYFDLPANERVLHLMGQPGETRHLVVANEQAVISPPWSIHAGAGTCGYTFCWAMAGENNTYTDLDQVALTSLL